MVISLVLLSVLIFLLPLFSYVNVFLLVIVWLSLAHSPYKWHFVISGGFLLDVFFKSYGLNLAAFTLAAFSLILLEDRVSHLTIMAKMSLAGVAIVANLTAYLVLAKLFSFFTGEAFGLLFDFNWLLILSYLITHLLLMLIILLIFKPKFSLGGLAG